MSLVNKSLSVFSREAIFFCLHIGTGAVMARVLGPLGIGMWAALDLLTNYCRVFGGLRFEIASVYFMGQGNYKKGETLFLANLAAFAVSVSLMVVLLINVNMVDKLFFKDTVIDPRLTLIVLAHLPLLFLKRNYLYFLLSFEDVRSYNMMMVLDDVSKTVITLVLLLIFKLGLWSIAIGLLCGSFISLFYGVVKVHKVEKMEFVFRKGLLKDMFQYSSKIYFSEAFGFLTIYLSNLITAVMLSPAALAFFSMGKGKTELLKRITDAIGTVFYPKISNLRGERDSSILVTTRAFRLSLILLVAVSIVLSLSIYPATIVLYGRKFIPLTAVFFIIIPSMAFYNASGLQRQYFLGIGRADIPLKMSIVPLVLQIGLCYLLMPTMGYLGGAVAVTVTFFATAIITVMVYKYSTAESYKEMFVPKREDLVFLWGILKERTGSLINKMKAVISMSNKLVVKPQTP